VNSGNSDEHRNWLPGDEANGYRLSAAGVWEKIPAPQPPVQPPAQSSAQSWKPGDVANGYRLSPAGVWEKIAPTSPAGKKSWYTRPLGIAGLVIALLFAFTVTVGAFAEDPDDTDPSANDATSEGEEPPAPASEKPETASGSADADSDDERSAESKPKRTYVVTHVVDGDTVDLGNGETVRIVGIDTPERGDCNYERAAMFMAEMVLGKAVTLGESDEDRDSYDRLLRYVDVGTMDAGLRMIKSGYAIARYDSRDGYGAHPREARYIAVDATSEPKPCPAQPVPLVMPPSDDNDNDGGGGNCMAGYSPCLPITGDLDCGDINGPVKVTGSDPYRLDADGDGIGCDS
jgi:endonuclease YncB( thermonuclease family)